MLRTLTIRYSVTRITITIAVGDAIIVIEIPLTLASCYLHGAELPESDGRRILHADWRRKRDYGADLWIGLN